MSASCLSPTKIKASLLKIITFQIYAQFCTTSLDFDNTEKASEKYHHGLADLTLALLKQPFNESLFLHFMSAS